MVIGHDLTVTCARKVDSSAQRLRTQDRLLRCCHRLSYADGGHQHADEKIAWSASRPTASDAALVEDSMGW